MRVMISQPMAGKDEEEIERKRNTVKHMLETFGHEVADTLFEFDAPEDSNPPVFYLAKSIEAMSMCDAVYFCDGWYNNRGCLIEYEVAKQYGLELLFE